jgi:hypothetical protein
MEGCKMMKKAIVSLPILINTNMDGIPSYSPESINELISVLEGKIHEASGIKFNAIPVLNVSSVCAFYDNDSWDTPNLPYFTGDIISRAIKEFKFELGECLSDFLDAEFGSDPFIMDESSAKEIIDESDSVLPMIFCINLYFLSSEMNHCNNFFQFDNDNSKEIKAVIERYFDSNGVKITSFVMTPIIGVIDYDGNRALSFSCNEDEFDLSENLLKISQDIEPMLILNKESDDIYNEDLSALSFETTIKNIAKQRVMKENSYCALLFWKGTYLGTITFNEERARIATYSYDEFAEAAFFYLPEYFDYQNSRLNVFLGEIKPECYSESDEDYTRIKYKNFDFSLMDKPLCRAFSYDNGSITSCVRKEYSDDNVFSSIIEGKSYIESIEDRLSNANASGIGVASYIRYNDGEYFHIVVTVYGKKGKVKHGVILCEESFSDLDIAERNEMGWLYKKTESFKEMAARLGIEFWNIEREYDYSIDNEGFPRAERKQVDKECRMSLVFIMADEMGMVFERKSGDEELTKKIINLISINAFSESERDLVKIYCEEQPRYLWPFNDAEAINNFIHEYANRLKQALPDSRVVMPSQQIDAMTKHKNYGAIAYGVVVEAPASLLGEIKVALGSIKMAEMMAKNPEFSHLVGVPSIVSNERFDIGRSFGAKNQHTFFFDVCSSS